MRMMITMFALLLAMALIAASLLYAYHFVEGVARTLEYWQTKDVSARAEYGSIGMFFKAAQGGNFEAILELFGPNAAWEMIK